VRRAANPEEKEGRRTVLLHTGMEEVICFFREKGRKKGGLIVEDELFGEERRERRGVSSAIDTRRWIARRKKDFLQRAKSP